MCNTRVVHGAISFGILHVELSYRCRTDMADHNTPCPSADSHGRVVLSGFLEDCRSTIGEILREAKAETIPALRVQYTLAAAKLMRTSVEIVQALERETRQTTHRVVIERAGEGETPSKNLQTIHGAASEASNNG
jgi:hypothetical protein